MPRRKDTRDHHIYTLYDARPETLAARGGAPHGRYGGETVDQGGAEKSLKARLYGHKYYARHGRCNPRLAAWINACGEHLGIMYNRTVPADQWIEAEKSWIANLRFVFGDDILNVTNGLIHTNESRAKMSAALKGKRRGPYKAYRTPEKLGYRL